MENFKGQEYKQQLFSYFGLDMEQGLYNPIFQDIDKIVEDTQQFSNLLLERMKQQNCIYHGNIFTRFSMGDVDYVVNGKIEAGIFDTLLQLSIGQDTWISEKLLQQFFPGFQICDKYSVKEEFEPVRGIDGIEGIGVFKEYIELCVSGPIQTFEKLYNENVNHKNKQKILKDDMNRVLK